mgnify:CR=1 FL=1
MKVFLASHGHLASGMASSIEILMGKQDNLTTFDAYIEGQSDTVDEHVEAFLASTGPEEVKILLSDIYGGSVNQILMKYIDTPNTYLVSGVTLSILLELLTKDDDMTREDLEEVVSGARELTKVVTLDVHVEEDSFF